MVESSDDASDIRTSKISDINVHDVVTILPYKLCTCQDSAYMYFRQLCHVRKCAWCKILLCNDSSPCQTTACSADVDATYMRMMLILHVFADSSPISIACMHCRNLWYIHVHDVDTMVQSMSIAYMYCRHQSYKCTFCTLCGFYKHCAVHVKCLHVLQTYIYMYMYYMYIIHFGFLVSYSLRARTEKILMMTLTLTLCFYCKGLLFAERNSVFYSLHVQISCVVIRRLASNYGKYSKNVTK